MLCSCVSNEYVLCASIRSVCLLREQAGVNCKHLKLVSRVGLCALYCALALTTAGRVISVGIKVSQCCLHWGAIWEINVPQREILFIGSVSATPVVTGPEGLAFKILSFFIRRKSFSQKCQWQIQHHHSQCCCGTAAPCWAPVYMHAERWAPWCGGHSFNGRNATHAVWQCVSLSHTQAEIPWPVILAVRDSSFRWEELVLKGEEGFFLHCRVERAASVGPSKAQGQTLRLTHTHTTRSHTGPDCTRRTQMRCTHLGTARLR